MIDKILRGPYVTGHCSIGAHQGAKKISPSGKEFLPCWGFSGVCLCWCHEIARDIGMPDTRPVPASSSWVLPPPPDYLPDAGNGPRGTAKGPPTFAPTASGRRSRGELEWSVLEAAQKFLDVGMPPTPRMVSAQIEGTPSTGAVQAVLERWVQIGFALPLQQRPVALLGLTPEGKKMGLQGMKDLNSGARRRRRGQALRTGRSD